MEMARLALSTRFEGIINGILEEVNGRDNTFICEPEALTYFANGMGSSGPRHHDLLMVGEETVIGIEAKVSESFDKRIKEKREKAGQNMNTRLDSCLHFMYGENLPDNAENLYYQLFSATIGTILEAQRKGKKRAIALFLTFVGNVCKEKDYEDKVSEKKLAFKEFCSTLGLDENGGKISDVPGIENEEIESWILNVEITI